MTEPLWAPTLTSHLKNSLASQETSLWEELCHTVQCMGPIPCKTIQKEWANKTGELMKCFHQDRSRLNRKCKLVLILPGTSLKYMRLLTFKFPHLQCISERDHLACQRTKFKKNRSRILIACQFHRVWSQARWHHYRVSHSWVRVDFSKNSEGSKQLK